MTITSHFNKNQSWEDKVVDGDHIWGQVKSLLRIHNAALPETPRRPDVRMIVENISGDTIRFNNPGDHSGSKEETIPGDGEKRAVMVMIKGDNLDAQNKNAKILFDRYDLGNQGLSQEFVNDMQSGRLSDLVDEAYGPAPFASQAEKLVDVEWPNEAGDTVTVKPEHGVHAAYGARAATLEKVILAKFNIFVKGTGTTAELVESSGMNIAVSSDWQTGKETTRPIVPSVGKVYYGSHFNAIPVVQVHPDGLVREIDLGNGTVIRAENTPVARNKPARPNHK